jgi:hypothetical protein
MDLGPIINTRLTSRLAVLDLYLCPRAFQIDNFQGKIGVPLSDRSSQNGYEADDCAVSCANPYNPYMPELQVNCRL